VIEQKINEFFGDAEATGFGTGWWSGILSAFFGFLSFGGVLCLHFPQLLSSPELRPHYPMQTMRVLIQCLIVGAILFGIISSITRKKKTLALTGMLLAIAATALGGSSVQINSDLHNGPAIGLDWFLLDLLLMAIIYVPLETPLLRRARERGLRAADGLGMLLHQAVPGFERWFGVRPEGITTRQSLRRSDIDSTTTCLSSRPNVPASM